VKRAQQRQQRRSRRQQEPDIEPPIPPHVDRARARQLRHRQPTERPHRSSLKQPRRTADESNADDGNANESHAGRHQRPPEPAQGTQPQQVDQRTQERSDKERGSAPHRETRTHE
jgi:hypothetical protein